MNNPKYVRHLYICIHLLMLPQGNRGQASTSNEEDSELDVESSPLPPSDIELDSTSESEKSQGSVVSGQGGEEKERSSSPRPLTQVPEQPKYIKGTQYSKPVTRSSKQKQGELVDDSIEEFEQ
jgi:hypothetical protein